jgi:hypothetical protein
MTEIEGQPYTTYPPPLPPKPVYEPQPVYEQPRAPQSVPVPTYFQTKASKWGSRADMLGKNVGQFYQTVSSWKPLMLTLCIIFLMTVIFVIYNAVTMTASRKATALGLSAGLIIPILIALQTFLCYKGVTVAAYGLMVLTPFVLAGLFYWIEKS